MNDVDKTLYALIECLRKKAPEYVAMLAADSEDSFESAFLGHLERAIHGMETSSRGFFSLDEVALTAVLRLALAVPGLTVTQESHSNGHVDITVTADHCTPMRKKLGEAKIYDGPDWHLRGLAQLMGRYSTGREGRGFVISFVKQPGVADLVTKVRSRMDAEMPSNQQGKTEDLPMRWSFLSRHSHTSGQVLDVGHVSCNLYASSGIK